MNSFQPQRFFNFLEELLARDGTFKMFMSTTSHFQSMACRCGAYKEAHLKLGCFLHEPKSLC
jgi:hypothetical protein